MHFAFATETHVKCWRFLTAKDPLLDKYHTRKFNTSWIWIVNQNRISQLNTHVCTPRRTFNRFWKAEFISTEWLINDCRRMSRQFVVVRPRDKHCQFVFNPHVLCMLTCLKCLKTNAFFRISSKTLKCENRQSCSSPKNQPGNEAKSPGKTYGDGNKSLNASRV